MDVVLSNCKDKMTAVLRIDVDGIHGIDDAFSGSHCQPFSNLKTAYHQTKYIETRLPYVV